MHHHVCDTDIDRAAHRLMQLFEEEQRIHAQAFSLGMYLLHSCQQRRRTLGYKYLAAMFGVTDRTIGCWVGLLKSLGILRQVKRGGYQQLLPGKPEDDPEATAEATAEDAPEAAAENTTEIRTENHAEIATEAIASANPNSLGIADTCSKKAAEGFRQRRIKDQGSRIREEEKRPPNRFSSSRHEDSPGGWVSPELIEFNKQRARALIERLASKSRSPADNSET